MEFVRAVQSGDVPWPTSRRFDSEEWIQRAQSLKEDDADEALKVCGLWIADLLAEIRSEVYSLSIWGLDTDTRLRIILGVANSDFAMTTHHFRSGAMTRKTQSFIVMSADEQAYDSFDGMVF